MKQGVFLIHPGWCLIEEHKRELTRIRECQIHGSYDEYTKNIQQLQGLIAHSPIPSKKLITEFEYLQLLHGGHQEFSNIVHYFRNENISDILLAGELGPCSNGRGYLGTIEGCVGSVARILKIKGFNVRGIQGCVFPLTPYEPHFLEEQKRICSRPPFSELIKLPHNREGFEETKKEMRGATRVLYEDAIRIEDIV